MIWIGKREGSGVKQCLNLCDRLILNVLENVRLPIAQSP